MNKEKEYELYAPLISKLQCSLLNMNDGARQWYRIEHKAMERRLKKHISKEYRDRWVKVRRETLPLLSKILKGIKNEYI